MAIFLTTETFSIVRIVNRPLLQLSCRGQVWQDASVCYNVRTRNLLNLDYGSNKLQQTKGTYRLELT